MVTLNATHSTRPCAVRVSEHSSVAHLSTCSRWPNNNNMPIAPHSMHSIRRTITPFPHHPRTQSHDRQAPLALLTENNARFSHKKITNHLRPLIVDQGKYIILRSGAIPSTETVRNA